MTPEEIAKLPYRPCVGLMVVNAAGLIWAGRRSDGPGDAWQMPQGGVDPGEAPRDAAMRELGEETSIPASAVEVLAESEGWIPYDLPHDLVPKLWKGRYRGQAQKWFLLRFDGPEDVISIETDEPEFVEWAWMAFPELLEKIVPFKADVYREVWNAFGSHVDALRGAAAGDGS